MSSIVDRPIPTPAILGAGLLILTTVIGVAVIQLNKHFQPPATVDSGLATETRDLRFVDEGDGVTVYGGHVRVYDAATGAEFPQLRENDGFIRAVLNSLAFERTKRGISGPPIFELAYWPDSRITIKDLATGARISLGAFGEKNKTVYLRFFASPGAGS